MPRTIGSKNNTKYKYQLIDEVNKTKKLYKTMTDIANEYDVNVISIHRLFNRVTKQGIFKNIKVSRVNIPCFQMVEKSNVETF